MVSYATPPHSMTAHDLETNSSISSASVSSSRRIARARTALRRRTRVAVHAVALAAAVASLGSPAAPVGIRVLDLLWLAGFAGVTTLIGARARRSALVWSSGVAALGAAPAPQLLVPAIAAFAAGVWSAHRTHRDRALSAAVSGVTVNVLLRLPGARPFGLTAFVTLVALAPLPLSAWRVLRSRTRRAVRRVAIGFAGTMAACIVGAVAALALGSAPLQQGADAADRALEAALSGDAPAAALSFSRSSHEFRSAQRSFDSWWARPARAVPVLGTHVETFAKVAGIGKRLSDSGAATAVASDVQRVTVTNGRVDLDALEATRPPLVRSREIAIASRRELQGLRRPWLVDPVQSRLTDIDARLHRSIDDAAVALDALRVAPLILGRDEPRRYLVGFLNNAELRGSGGIFGSYAEVTAERGDIEMVDSGRVSAELNPGGLGAGRVLHAPRDYIERYSGFQPQVFWQNVSFSPDWPTVAQVAQDLYPQSGRPPVDVVIGIDPFGIAALLRLTGPISVPGLAEPLTSANAAQILLRDQYLNYPDLDERSDFLESASRSLVEKITTGSLPGPRTAVRALLGAVRGGHLKIWSARPDEEALFRRMTIAGAMPTTDGDFLSVVSANVSPDKADTFLQRRISYTGTFDPRTGEVRASAKVSLHNAAPASGLPPYVLGFQNPGVNRTVVSIYSSLGLGGAEIAGTPIALQAERELGRQVFSTTLSIPPGATVELTVSLRGRLASRSTTGDSLAYQLLVSPQPVPNPDRLHVDIHELGSGYRARFDGTLRAPSYVRTR
jgi:hypothetical protein